MSVEVKSANEGINTEASPSTAVSQPAVDVTALMAKIAELEKKLGTQASTEASLNDKVKRERDDFERRQSETKVLESALLFNHSAMDFVKQNESVLPEDIALLIEASNKEKYDSGIQKANATKAAIIQSVFSVQNNYELLTESQKSIVAEYLKLTKNGKEDKANEIWGNILEPVLYSAKKVKKAEELAKARMGFRDTKGDSQYRQKIINLSKQHYLGEKR